MKHFVIIQNSVQQIIKYLECKSHIFHLNSNEKKSTVSEKIMEFPPIFNQVSVLHNQYQYCNSHKIKSICTLPYRTVPFRIVPYRIVHRKELKTIGEHDTVIPLTLLAFFKKS
jgi:hypothetical protein